MYPTAIIILVALNKSHFHGTSLGVPISTISFSRSAKEGSVSQDENDEDPDWVLPPQARPLLTSLPTRGAHASPPVLSNGLLLPRAREKSYRHSELRESDVDYMSRRTL